MGGRGEPRGMLAKGAHPYPKVEPYVKFYLYPFLSLGLKEKCVCFD